MTAHDSPTTAATSDERPALRIAWRTWEREDELRRRSLVLEAAQLGFRLVVVGADRVQWAPDPETADWNGRVSG